jgi:hypothetical protein
MRIDFRDIRSRFELWKARQQLRGALALFNLIRPLVIRAGSQEQKEKLVPEWEAFDQEATGRINATHRWALFTSVGQSLSHWAGMEESLVAITTLLLRSHEANKVGIILYSIINFNTWLGIIGELFSQEPLYSPLKPRWNKISERLRGLKDVRDRLAHHTIHYGDKATTDKGATSLRPGRFDIRQKSQKYEPLEVDQIFAFGDSLGKVQEDLTALLNAMTALLSNETSQRRSSAPTPDQHHP